jgi:hypothetical protein
MIPDINHHTFTQLLEYLYTDDVHITMDTAMNLFQVSATIFQFIFIYNISTSIIIIFIIHYHPSILALSIPFHLRIPLISFFPFLPLLYLNSNKQAADRFGIDRLKKLCEQEMLSAINLETAPYIFYSADRYNAEVSRYLRQ